MCIRDSVERVADGGNIFAGGGCGVRPLLWSEVVFAELVAEFELGEPEGAKESLGGVEFA